MAKVTIDNREYDTENFTQEALDHLNSLQFTRGEVARLQMQIAAMQTATNAYIRALKATLEKDDDAQKIAKMPPSISFD